MSSLVLARKYRPRSFEQMVGQEHVVRALGNALASGRLHHAYLFTGTRGIGKTTVSRILAKSLNCTGADGQGGVTAQPCGVCSACTQIDADRFIDYIELDAASNRSIEEIRDLIERAAYKPSVGRYKVFMIDEAHQLTKDAFNALLKTLEEPPEYLKFVLATTDPEKMLPTVLSRCLQFNLRPMAPEVVREHLARVLQAEGVQVDDAALRLLGRAARGSMRDALSLTDQAIAYGGGRVDETVVRQMLGAVDRTHATQALRALAARDGPALLEVVAALRAQGLSASATLEEMARLLQLMAVEQAVPGALDETDPETAEVRALAALWPADETQLLYSMLVHGQGELAWVSDEHSALTMILLRLFAFPAQEADGRPRAPRAQPLRAPATAVASVALPPAAKPAPPVPAVATAQEAKPPAVAASVRPETAPATPPVLPSPTPATLPSEQGPDIDRDLGDRWAQVVTALDAQRAIGALTRELAMQAGLLAIHERAGKPMWVLCVESESLRSEAHRERLTTALAAYLGHEVSIELQPGTPSDTPARREAQARAERLAQAEAEIRNDPLVQELLQQFKGARIVPGSIKPLLREEGKTP